MLTTEQEQKIGEAAYKAYGFGSITPQSVVNAIVTSIRYYDKLKEAEEVKTAANDSGNDDDCYVVFKPNGKYSSEIYSSKMWVFNSIRDMAEKLNAKYNEYTYQGSIEIRPDIVSLYNMENAQEVYLVKYEGKRCVLSDRIGFCDCKTFKKG